MSDATRTPPVVAPMTLEQYLALPMTRARHEVIDGAIVMSPAPTGDHQLILGALLHHLFHQVTPVRLGSLIMAPFDVLIRTEPKLRIRQPDLSYFSNARIDRRELRQSAIARVAPDLAIEVCSPSETESDWAAKLEDYASIAITEVWRVLPETGSVEVLGLVAGAYERVGTYRAGEAVRSLILPDLDLPVAAIFA